MNAPIKPMTVEDFIDWALLQPRGRFELVRGEIVAMNAERTGHIRAKVRAVFALERAIAATGIECNVLGDGATVRIDNYTAFEPDALVYCGTELPDDTIIIPEPVIVAEVLSPSTTQVDLTRKLAGYFKVPTIQHYLIVDWEGREVIHHQRQADGSIRTLIVPDGSITLDPPGFSVALAEMLPPARKS